MSRLVTARLSLAPLAASAVLTCLVQSWGEVKPSQISPLFRFRYNQHGASISHRVRQLTRETDACVVPNFDCSTERGLVTPVNGKADSYNVKIDAHRNGNVKRFNDRESGITNENFGRENCQPLQVAKQNNWLTFLGARCSSMVALACARSSWSFLHYKYGQATMRHENTTVGQDTENGKTHQCA